MYEEEMVSVNAEVRYISLEILKAATSKKKNVQDIESFAQELSGVFVRNTCYLNNLIKEATPEEAPAPRKATRR